MKVSVVGLGWYGIPLAKELIQAGHVVSGTTRDPQKLVHLKNSGIKTYLLESPSLPPPEILDADILIINIPPQEHQLEWLKKWPIASSTWPIFISSTSGKPSLLQTEEWIQKSFAYWTILRFAGLIGAHRHPGKSLSGKKNLSGRLWPVNLLHQDDAVGFTLAVIEKKITNEIIGVLSDEHHTREEFYTEFAHRMGLPLPEFDQEDKNVRPALDNKRAKEIYAFKWTRMIGTTL